LWVVFPPWGKYGNAAVVHDFLYWVQDRSRFKADKIFLEAMGVLGVSLWEKYSMFLTVRLFGWYVWWSNPRRKRKGFEKIGEPIPLGSVLICR
jgi:hypothetical protein